MANASVRTKTLRGGTRARAAKPGETREQQREWQGRLVEQGIPSIVFASQSMLDEYCQRLKAFRKREALRGRLERKYFAGALALKAKKSKALATA
jgi:hypothetical protein